METISTQEFSTKINSNKPVVIDFSASWCGPCKAMAPILEDLSKEITEIDFFKIDIDDDPIPAIKYGVTGVPTLVVFKDGEAIGNHVGLVSKTKLKNFLVTLIK